MIHNTDSGIMEPARKPLTATKPKPMVQVLSTDLRGLRLPRCHAPHARRCTSGAKEGGLEKRKREDTLPKLARRFPEGPFVNVSLVQLPC